MTLATQRKRVPNLDQRWHSRTLFIIVLASTLLIISPLDADTILSCKAQSPQAKDYECDYSSSEPTCFANSSLPGGSQSSSDKSNKLDDHNQWVWQYFDEQKPGSNGDLLIHEDSIDERLANIVHTVNRAKMVNFDHVTFNLGDPKLNKEYEQLAAGSKFNEELCGQELSKMLGLIEEMEHILGDKRQNNSSKKIDERHINLAQVLDSFGRYEAGVLLGRTHFLGEYSQCIGSRMILNQEKPEAKTAARYCIAKLRVDRHLDPALKARRRKKFEMNNLLNVAICIPESCHTLSFHKQKHLFKKLIDSQFKLPRSIFIDENLELDSVYCLADDDSYLAKIPFSGKLFITFMIGWLGLAIFATFYNNNNDTTTKRYQPTINTWLNHVNDSLDLRQSWEDFTRGNKRVSAGRINLDTLNSIKVIGCLFVIFCHTLRFQMTVIMDTLSGYTAFEADPWLMGLFGGSVIVDTFYVMSGIMLAYLTLKKFNNKQAIKSENALIQFSKQCFQFTAIRYLRLLPLYFIVFWFKKSLFTHLGSGPMWDHGSNVETEAGACKLESWSTPFTTMAAYLPLTAQCLPHAWSIAGDLFFSITLAPIIVLMVKRPKLAAFLSVLLCVASNAAMLVEVGKLPVSSVYEIRQLRFHAAVGTIKDMSSIYTAPHFRVFSVLIGALAGYALYHYNQSAESLKEWPGWFKGPATKLSFTFIALTVSAFPLSVLSKPWLTKSFPFYHLMFEHSTTTCRLFWSLANATVFLRMVTDWKDNSWMQDSAGKFWQCMSRLNYPILLIHTNVLSYDMHVQDTLGTFSRYQFISKFAFIYMFSCLLGLIVHICIENPIDKLTKGFMYGDRSRGQAENLKILEKE